MYIGVFIKFNYTVASYEITHVVFLHNINQILTYIQFFKGKTKKLIAHEINNLLVLMLQELRT